MPVRCGEGNNQGADTGFVGGGSTAYRAVHYIIANRCVTTGHGLPVSADKPFDKPNTDFRSLSASVLLLADDTSS